jgi:hypothetical protein
MLLVFLLVMLIEHEFIFARVYRTTHYRSCGFAMTGKMSQVQILRYMKGVDVLLLRPNQVGDSE